jgi:hypothetical protein
MMPKLISLFRTEWSKEPGTTAPTAPFGLVSLSSHDSEGAADMASFRWAQQGSYGTVPNTLMPNTFMAHAFDLQDPWNGNTGACTTHSFPGYDCSTPWFMGPSKHSAPLPCSCHLCATVLCQRVYQRLGLSGTGTHARTQTDKETRARAHTPFTGFKHAYPQPAMTPPNQRHPSAAEETCWSTAGAWCIAGSVWPRRWVCWRCGSRVHV